MNSPSNRSPRKPFRESDNFRKFQEVVQHGFVQQGTELPKPELLQLSERLAKMLSRSDRRDFDTVNHVRRFFNQVSGLKNVQDTVKLEVELQMLKARIAYATGRHTISRDFSLVIQESLDRILGCGQIAEQLPGFCGFFEALYAYYYYHAQRDARRRRT